MGVGSDRILLSSILEKNGANFLIFDDGFQNLNFKASITVLAVTDATPSEVVFRDFRSAAQFADLVVQTKGLKTTPGLKAHFKIDWLAEELPNKPIWLLCAVADPSEVAQFYRNQGVKIEKVIALKDHSDLNAERVKNLMLLARSSGAVLSVTEKDKVKLEGEAFSALFVLRRRMLNDDWMEFIFERLHSSVQMR